MEGLRGESVVTVKDYLLLVVHESDTNNYRKESLLFGKRDLHLNMKASLLFQQFPNSLVLIIKVE